MAELERYKTSNYAPYIPRVDLERKVWICRDLGDVKNLSELVGGCLGRGFRNLLKFMLELAKRYRICHTDICRVENLRLINDKKDVFPIDWDEAESDRVFPYRGFAGMRTCSVDYPAFFRMWWPLHAGSIIVRGFEKCV